MAIVNVSTRARGAIRTTEPTRYEIVLEHPERQTRALIGYTAQHSGSGLRRYMASMADRILAEVGEETVDLRYEGGHGTAQRIILSTGHVIRFSGRTEREACGAGEYGRIAPVPLRPARGAAGPYTCITADGVESAYVVG